MGESSNDRAGLHKELGFLLIAFLFFVCSCTYIDTQESGMTEWDYKMYNEGWHQVYSVVGNEVMTSYDKEQPSEENSIEESGTEGAGGGD